MVGPRTHRRTQSRHPRPAAFAGPPPENSGARDAAQQQSDRFAERLGYTTSLPSAINLVAHTGLFYSRISAPPEEIGGHGHSAAYNNCESQNGFATPERGAQRSTIDNVPTRVLRMERLMESHQRHSESDGTPRTSAWLSCCRRKLPGAMPLQGALERSTEEIDVMLKPALTMEAKDHTNVTRGFHDSLIREQGILLKEIEELGDKMSTERPDTNPLTADAVMLSFVILARFLGRLEPNDLLSVEELRLLPAVCLNTAMKIEDSTCGTVVPALLGALAISKRMRLETKRRMSRLEMRVISTLEYRLTSPTPATFLHHLLARTVAKGVLCQAQTVAIGCEATQTAFRLVRSGFCSVYKPSEVASVSVFIAAFSFCEVSLEVARAVGCRFECRSTLTLLYLAVDPSEQVMHASGSGHLGVGSFGRNSNDERQGRCKEVGSNRSGPSNGPLLEFISQQWKANFPREPCPWRGVHGDDSGTNSNVQHPQKVAKACSDMSPHTADAANTGSYYAHGIRAAWPQRTMETLVKPPPLLVADKRGSRARSTGATAGAVPRRSAIPAACAANAFEGRSVGVASTGRFGVTSPPPPPPPPPPRLGINSGGAMAATQASFPGYAQHLLAGTSSAADVAASRGGGGASGDPRGGGHRSRYICDLARNVPPVYNSSHPTPAWVGGGTTVGAGGGGGGGGGIPRRANARWTQDGLLVPDDSLGQTASGRPSI